MQGALGGSRKSAGGGIGIPSDCGYACVIRLSSVSVVTCHNCPVSAASSQRRVLAGHGTLLLEGICFCDFPRPYYQASVCDPTQPNRFFQRFCWSHPRGSPHGTTSSWLERRHPTLRRRRGFTSFPYQGNVARNSLT